mgnify:CR=1 FL=1
MIEADEYDTAFFDKRSKFIHYTPHIAVLNNLEFDHADIYRDLDHVKSAFRRLVDIIPSDGSLVVCGDYPVAMEIAAAAPCERTTYGNGGDVDWTAKNLQFHEGRTFFEPCYRGKTEGRVELAGIVREHSIVLPSDLSLMFKALITLEGLGRQYDPDFHIINHLTPLVKSALAERYQPGELVRRSRNAVSEFLNVVVGVPRDLARFLREARRGKTRIDLDLKRLDSFGRQLDRTLDRVTVGIMTGAAIVLTVREGPEFLGIPVLPAIGLLGYVLAFLNSLWIVYGIWRSGRE